MSPTPRRPKPADTPPPDAVPLEGELAGQPVAVEGVVADEPLELQVQPTFTPEQIKEDGKNRVSRTDAQVASGAGTVIVIRYLLQKYLPGHLPPDDVLLAMVAIAAGIYARWANRHRLRGEG